MAKSNYSMNSCVIPGPDEGAISNMFQYPVCCHVGALSGTIRSIGDKLFNVEADGYPNSLVPSGLSGIVLTFKSLSCGRISLRYTSSPAPSGGDLTLACGIGNCRARDAGSNSRWHLPLSLQQQTGWPSYDVPKPRSLRQDNL